MHGCRFCGLGDYGNDKEFYQRALGGYETALGRDHPVTLNIVNNMALAVALRGNYAGALARY